MEYIIDNLNCVNMYDCCSIFGYIWCYRPTDLGIVLEQSHWSMENRKSSEFYSFLLKNYAHQRVYNTV